MRSARETRSHVEADSSGISLNRQGLESRLNRYVSDLLQLPSLTSALHKRDIGMTQSYSVPAFIIYIQVKNDLNYHCCVGENTTNPLYCLCSLCQIIALFALLLFCTHVWFVQTL